MIKILVCLHKPYKLPTNAMYLPIQVGKAIASESLGIQGDDECIGDDGDSISELNGLYCEMTAMYWAWKNLRHLYPDTTHVGLCHYRRYFNANPPSPKNRLQRGLGTAKEVAKVLLGRSNGTSLYEPIEAIQGFDDHRFIASDASLTTIIQSHDLVYTTPVRIRNSNVREYFCTIGRQYIELLDTIIHDIHPEYERAYTSVMCGTRIVSANMIILKTDYLDEYCEFVFSTLEQHLALTKERGLCIDPLHEGMYARIPGYLAELLTATYVEAKKPVLDCSVVRKFFVE